MRSKNYLCVYKKGLPKNFVSPVFVCNIPLFIEKFSQTISNFFDVYKEIHTNSATIQEFHCNKQKIITSLTMSPLKIS
jgi:hypothetical protein